MIRIILGLIFIVSGWVKAIDPMGSFLKIGEYLSAAGFQFSESNITAMSVYLGAIELFLGLMLLFRLWERVTATLTSVMLSFFTIVTALIVIVPSLTVENCGCFGDAIIISNNAALVKNIILLALSIFYTVQVWRQFKELNSTHYYSLNRLSNSRKRQLFFYRSVVYLYIIVFTLVIPKYSYRNLPPFTFLPFDVGYDLREDTEEKKVDADVVENVTTLIYKNKATGEEVEFKINDTTWHDEDVWEYVSTKTTKSNFGANIEFSLYDTGRNNVAQQVVDNEGYTFLIIAEDITSIRNDFKKSVDNLLNLGTRYSDVSTAFITNSKEEEVTWLLRSMDIRNEDYQVYSADNVMIKSLLRAESGVVLIQNGKVVAKWNDRKKRIPNITYDEIDYVVRWESRRDMRYVIFVGLAFCVMILLAITYHKKKK